MIEKKTENNQFQIILPFDAGSQQISVKTHRWNADSSW